MKTHLLKTGGLAMAAIAAATALSGCIVVPARPYYAAPPPAVYVEPVPVYVGPPVWISGRWVYRR